jgi:hypothetical protein
MTTGSFEADVREWRVVADKSRRRPQASRDERLSVIGRGRLTGVHRIPTANVLVGHEVPKEVHKIVRPVKQVSLVRQFRLDIVAGQSMCEQTARKVECRSFHGVPAYLKADAVERQVVAAHSDFPRL